MEAAEASQIVSFMEHPMAKIELIEDQKTVAVECVPKQAKPA
jgi:hypothetical protein